MRQRNWGVWNTEDGREVKTAGLHNVVVGKGARLRWVGQVDSKGEIKKFAEFVLGDPSKGGSY
jgi:hypothetical protein